MDWEGKFSSIVRETESNLAKVKVIKCNFPNDSSVTIAINYDSFTNPTSSCIIGYYFFYLIDVC